MPDETLLPEPPAIATEEAEAAVPVKPAPAEESRANQTTLSEYL